MSFLSDNVIPGNHGQIFSTNAEELEDLEHIKIEILKLKGIKDVVINSEVFPNEFTVYTDDLIKVKEIEDAVQLTNFHAIPKSLFKF